MVYYKPYISRVVLIPLYTLNNQLGALFHCSPGGRWPYGCWQLPGWCWHQCRATRKKDTGVSGCRCVMFEVQKSLNDDLDVFFWQPLLVEVYIISLLCFYTQLARCFHNHKSMRLWRFREIMLHFQHQEPQSSSSSFYLGRWYSSRVLVVTCIIMRGAPGLAKLGIESVKAVRKFGEMSKAWHNLTINQWIDIHHLF